MVREARIFKYGSGTGSNFSKLRGEGEALSGGGKSSGLMSFLKIGDRAAGAIKSGGTTRRAAKMVTLDLDHPDIEDYVNWKVVEERKVASLVAGSKITKRCLQDIVKAVWSWPDDSTRFHPSKNGDLAKAIRAAAQAFVPTNYINRCVQLAKNGAKEIVFEEYDTDWNSQAYSTVSGQNSNNSVRVPNEFMDAVERGGNWRLYHRTELAKAITESRTPNPCRRLMPIPFGIRLPTPPGAAPIPVCNSTQRSMNGTRAPTMNRFSPAIHARNTCSSTTPRATWRRST